MFILYVLLTICGLRCTNRNYFPGALFCFRRNFLFILVPSAVPLAPGVLYPFAAPTSQYPHLLTLHSTVSSQRSLCPLHVQLRTNKSVSSRDGFSIGTANEMARAKNNFHSFFFFFIFSSHFIPSYLRFIKRRRQYLRLCGVE